MSEKQWPPASVGWSVDLRPQMPLWWYQWHGFAPLPQPVQPAGSGLARALGYQGGAVPSSLDPLPVAVMADYSGRLAPEALEPRALIASAQSGTAITASFLILQAPSAGGLVVEQLRASNNAMPNLENFRVFRRATDPFAGIGSAVAVLPIGGSAPSTLARHGDASNVPGDGVLIQTTELVDFRAWVPPGWWFGFQQFAPNTRHLIQLVVRELRDSAPGAIA